MLFDLCRFPEHEIALVDMHSKPGSPWQYCPRSTLRNVTQILEKEFGLVSGCHKLQESHLAIVLNLLVLFQVLVTRMFLI